ncbi:VOC family protein [Fodinicurvata sediminis]|uniref:VOC family protein n=1 Tax=Fodinicurvata sediminis TaxID=1121832 RepID=UPI0003B5BC51|nr:VOC family protein [Fodinicurvata sediminis]
MTQLPARNQIFLDHVAHFVPSLEDASAAMEAAGFVLTPFTRQQNRTPEGMVPSGMANRCIMLDEGYIELLTAVSETELSRQFQQAVERYVGLHLIALACGDAEAAHAHLEREDFAPNEPVNLTRPVEGEEGEEMEARFTVLRVNPGIMPEGRIQILEHHTEKAVWQPRFKAHDNAVRSLKAVLLVVEDPQEAAVRFGRFCGRPSEACGDGKFRLELDRGSCVFLSREAASAQLPWLKEGLQAPWMAVQALGSSDLPRTVERFSAAGFTVIAGSVESGEVTFRLPAALGGYLSVVAHDAQPSWAA